MKRLTSILKLTSVVAIIALLFIGCEQEFTTIDSDIINEETATNFNTVSEKYDVISYTDALGPVQTNALPFGLNSLGLFNDPTYGRTTASIVTQVTAALSSPDFGDNVVLDSVVLKIPYFSRNIGLTEEGNNNYELDSILPRNQPYQDFKLSIFENNYFLRNFDPAADFNIPQAYFSNKTVSLNEDISAMSLEGTPINYYSLDPETPDILSTDNRFRISDKGIILKVPSNDPDNPDAEPVISQRLTPSLRLKLETTFWNEKIINANPTDLSNANNFNNYFRGLYFKVEPFGMQSGSLIQFSLTSQASNIILYYTRDSNTEGEEREQDSYTLSFGPNTINFLENNFTTNIVDGNQTEGDSRLFLKGGEGAIARISLFNGENVDDDDSSNNEFESWRNDFINLDEDGNFESFKRLVNEANLVFYVDQTAVEGEEPERLYLYNYTTNQPLSDYFLDVENQTLPALSRLSHLGVLQKEETTNKGIKYKMRITNHLNDLLTNNAENVQLGLAVTGNLNLEATFSQRLEQTTDNTEKRVPISSIITPRGTILHGNQSENLEKRLYLEIFYTF